MLPPIGDPAWVEARDRLTRPAREKAERAQARARKRKLKAERKQRKSVKVGEQRARLALARVGDPMVADRAAQVVAAMRANEWYAVEDIVRLTRTWPAWARSGIKWAKANGWLIGAAGVVLRGEPMLWRLSDKGEAAKGALEAPRGL